MKRKRQPIRDFLWRHSAGFAFLAMLLFVAMLAFVGYEYVTVTRKFDSSRRWDLPSRVYSDALPILPGLAYPRSLLEPKLNHAGYHAVTREVSNPGEYRYAGGGLEVYLQSFSYPDIEFAGMPVRITFEDGRVSGIRRLGDNAKLRAVRIEPELITSIYDEVMEDRVPVPLGQVATVLVDAVIATEDRAFFRHEGISLRGIARAAWTNYRSGAIRAGGSTLTQQLVKNLFLSHERKIGRKLREALMAVILESRYSKEEILEAYLNEIYLGQNGSVQIVGVEQASQIYFGKRAKYLTLGEAATLAGMIRSPNIASPLRAPERARARRDVVLASMLELGKIDRIRHDKEVAKPLSVNAYPRSIRSAPFFVDLVLKQLRETYPQTQLETEGLRIFTTLDTTMQRAAEQAIESGIASLTKKYRTIRKADAPLEGVVLTIQPGTGYVKALVGGRSYSRSQFNRAFQARRQPGSLFKPFVYTAAMDPARGSEALTAASILDDTPISIQTSSGAWRPQNYDGKFHGRTSVREALTLSYNIPAVRAAIDAGVPNVIKLASQIGVRSRLQPYPSISLGSFEVTPLEIAFAYSVFANEGVKAEPVTILAVATRDGHVLENREVKIHRVAPAAVIYVMNDILKDVLDRGTAASVRSLGFTRPFAGKTGTTNNYRDAWFVGYSPKILSLVWVGFDDGRTMRLSGSDAAVPIWAAYMKKIAGMVPNGDFRRPADVVERQIDPYTGMLASPYCPASETELFVAASTPAVCRLHGRDDYIPFQRERRPDGGVIAEGDERPDAQLPDEEGRERARRKRDKAYRRLLDWIFD